jgi:hypothetical protein
MEKTGTFVSLLYLQWIYVYQGIQSNPHADRSSMAEASDDRVNQRIKVATKGTPKIKGVFDSSVVLLRSGASLDGFFRINDKTKPQADCLRK